MQLTDVRLHYVEQGDGPLVLLLHGFPDFHYSWRHQLPALAEAGFRAVAPDLRGYNLSDKPGSVADYTLDRLATDVAELIPALGEGSARLVGHDWGGIVAYAAAAWHPDLIERLVVLNAPHIDDYGRGLRSPRQFRKSWYTGFFQMPGAPAVLRTRDFSGLRNALVGSSTPGAFTDEDLARYATAWSEPRAMESMLAYYRAGARRVFSRHSKLPTIERPTLVIWGENDRSMEDFFATPSPERVRDLTVEKLPGATHWVHMDEPQRVNELLLAFLA